MIIPVKYSLIPFFTTYKFMKKTGIPRRYEKKYGAPCAAPYYVG